MGQMYEQFKTDPKIEKDGIWINYSSLFRIRIARAGGSNMHYKKRLEKLTGPYERALKLGTMDPKLAKEIIMEAYADAIIQDWETKVDGEWVKGIESPDGEELLPVNKENIILTLTNLGDLFDDLQEQAGRMAIFRAAVREEQAGN
jgi:hypothetical protein